jgi:hypothetical protein
VFVAVCVCVWQYAATLTRTAAVSGGTSTGDAQYVCVSARHAELCRSDSALKFCVGVVVCRLACCVAACSLCSTCWLSDTVQLPSCMCKISYWHSLFAVAILLCQSRALQVVCTVTCMSSLSLHCDLRDRRSITVSSAIRRWRQAPVD